jgi:hypothetical protein
LREGEVRWSKPQTRWCSISSNGSPGRPRPYSEVIETWRTSCPRLTIWEDAVDRGYVVRQPVAGAGVRVAITEGGEKFLRAHGRLS